MVRAKVGDTLRLFNDDTVIRCGRDPEPRERATLAFDGDASYGWQAT